MSLQPHISIITVNYNNKIGLEKTFNSVFSLDNKDYEYIVIDGGSSDGSKELIKKNTDKIDFWVSESDKGIYNAMNKGIKKAKGEYLLFLNSGDIFYSSDVLKSCSQLFTGYDLIYYNIEFGVNSGNIINYPSKLSLKYFLSNMICHQAIFFSKKLFDKYGCYDENYRIIADWKFLVLALTKFNAKYLHVNKTLVSYDTTGLSSLNSNIKVLEDEKKDILKKEFDFIMVDYNESIKKEQLIAELKLSRAIKFLNKFGILKFIDKL